MSGRPYEALRFANRIRAGLNLKPAPTLVDKGDPILDTVRHGAKSVEAYWAGWDTIVASRGKTTLVRDLPMGALAFMTAYENEVISL